MEKPSHQHADGSCPQPLLVLHINDSTDDQVLFQAAARSAGVPIEWHVAESIERGISYFKSLVALGRDHPVRPVDLVLLDLMFHDGSGLAILKHIRETPELRRLPVVILTGMLDPATLKQAYDLGVDDLLEKPGSFDDATSLARSLYERWGALRSPPVKPSSQLLPN